MILPITPKFNYNKPLAFKARPVDPDEDIEELPVTMKAKELEKIKNNYYFNGMFVGSIISMIVTSAVSDSSYEKKITKALDLTSKELRMKNTNKDNFEVKDVNDDDVPEIILSKKDGTKVAIDVINGKLLKEKTYTKTYFDSEK